MSCGNPCFLRPGSEEIIVCGTFYTDEEQNQGASAVWLCPWCHLKVVTDLYERAKNDLDANSRILDAEQRVAREERFKLFDANRVILAAIAANERGDLGRVPGILLEYKNKHFPDPA